MIQNKYPKIQAYNVITVAHAVGDDTHIETLSFFWAESETQMSSLGQTNGREVKQANLLPVFAQRKIIW
jgi:hypothetical protein